MNNLDLNPQFKRALDLMENTNKHIFITGKAGTGKSTLLNYFRGSTKKNNVVLAPTGIAAVNIEGETIHSFFNFKPNINIREAKEVARNAKRSEFFKKLQMIVIDEISMVRADLMDCINAYLQTVYKTEMPFGGIQMVFIGDLFQLPPVLTNYEQEAFYQIYKSPYFFDSEAVQSIQNTLDGDIEYVELQSIYRQSDTLFVDLLNAVRNKNITKDQLDTLNQRYDIDRSDIPEGYVYLTSTNKIADTINAANLQKLPGKVYSLEGYADGNFDDKSLPTDIDLQLKIGARVMFLNNDVSDRWINGTLGTVKGINIEDEDEPIVEVKLDNGRTLQVEQNVWSNYASELNEESGLIERKEVGSFTQIPLKLAWAITIHKSQGKTFDNVVIDLGYGAFAHGQTYVALSRCRTLEGMVLKRPIRSTDIIMDSRVLEFTQTWTKS